MEKRYKYLVGIISFALIIIFSYIIISLYISHAFEKIMLLPPPETAVIDIHHFDTGNSLSIEKLEDKKYLLDMMKNNIRFLKLKPYAPLDAAHNTYSIIIHPKENAYVFYVSNEDQRFCFTSKGSYQFLIVGGDIIADYLDDCLANNAE